MKNMECAYSFDDLYLAVFNKPFAENLKVAFFAKSRNKINRQVLAWAKKAGWFTKERKGSDGEIYIAFAPHAF